ncbi:hypothetical protein FM106_26420 [Brachybacterium faecium]|nr:hypothetical protein FM106_26420 [Brachybacterium faecium]
MEEGVVLCVQCRTEVCGVQLDLPGSCDRRRRPGWSCQIETTRSAATVRTALDDAGAFLGGRSALAESRFWAVIRCRAPWEA